MKYISDYPSAQAEELQQHLKDLDRHNKLIREFKSRYEGNLGIETSLANYILKHWEDRGKKLFIEYTGIEVAGNKKNIIRAGLKLNEITKGSHRQLLWKCSTCQYEWVAEVANRVNSTDCPACSCNIVSDKNSLASWCDKQGAYGEKLKSEFRGSMSINKISYSSNKDTLWECSNCHYIWEASPNSRTGRLRSGCTACSDSINTCITGVNDLFTWCNRHGEYGQKIKEEFIGIDENNKQIKANEIAYGSHKKVKWRCKYCGYEWYAAIGNRTNRNLQSGCQACSCKVLCKGINDLETYCNKHKKLGYLLDEFVGEDIDNNKISPSEISKSSHIKCKWQCNKCKGIWYAKPNDRIYGSGCPYCNRSGTSFPEQYIYNSMKQIFSKSGNRVKSKFGYEYDIVIPELTLCIEYSGYSWHKDKIARDKIKEEYCNESGIHFLQIYAHTGGLVEPDTYTKEKIIYEIDRNKSNHIKQLQHIIKFILKEYNSEALYASIDFELAEQQANKVMGKA